MPKELKPFLNFQAIQDEYMRKNVQNLHDYFRDENQLLGFKFMELTFTSAKTGVKQAHGLSTTPLDILVTRITGLGTVTFQYGSFDDTYIVMDVTGACRIRFYVGTYAKLQSSVQTATTDEQEFFSTPEAAGKATYTSVSLPLSSKTLATGEYPGSTFSSFAVRATLDDVLIADATVQSLSVVLPRASLLSGRYVWVKKIDATANTVTISAVDLIDTATSIALSTKVAALFFCDGSTYYRLV